MHYNKPIGGASSALDPSRPFRSDDALLRHALALRTALPHTPLDGNRVEVLLDAPATHAAVFDAIDGARDHVNIEARLGEAEAPCAELARRLIARRRQGVKVNLLLDSTGASPGLATLEALQQAGVRVCACTSPAHRKLIVVDGRVAFTGGIDLAGLQPPPPALARWRWQWQRAPWRDTHLRIEGPAVAQLQQLFIEHWQACTGQRPYLAHYFPPLARPGVQRVGVAACESSGSGNPFYGALLRAIEHAQHRIRLTAASFVPPRRLLAALCRAARRGVNVQLLLPGMGEAWAPLQAGRAHYARLLRAGVQIFERLDALRHARAAVIDGVWATVGCSHLDRRSFVPNAEANVIVLDGSFGARLERVFADDLVRSEPIRLPDWRRRGARQRLLEWAAWPLARLR